jgi:uncharacterized membrane protein
VADLILKFKDETGAKRQVTVDGSRFTIGRSPDNNLQIANNALSRKHVQIERFGDIFVVSDAGSSNGTKLNGAELTAPVALQNGDSLLLGDTVELAVEIENALPVYSAASPSGYQNAGAANSNQETSGSFPTSIFFIAPIFGLVILVLVGVLIFVVSDRGREPVIAQQNNVEDFSEENTRPRRDKDEEEDEVEPRPTPSANRAAENSNNSPSANTTSSPVANPVSSEEEKVEKFALQFLRDISGDTNAVLSSKQIALVNAKIKSLKNSTGFRENLKSAGRNTAAFEKIGQEHNFKASFLAAAALAKMGDSRGEPSATAASIAPQIKDYANVLGLELANDALLVIAAYSEGTAPDAMRDRVAALVKNTPNVNVATVRTVWFLSEKDKLKPAAFDSVLRFIAAGTIMQDPKSFGL